MIVTALPNAHEQVDKLLADLRKNPATQPTAELTLEQKIKAGRLSEK